jgi:hypothetical protein
VTRDVPCAWPLHPPQEIDVVAALGEEQAAALALPPPVAADEGVRVVEPADGLEVLHVEDLSDGTRPDEADLGVLWRSN